MYLSAKIHSMFLLTEMSQQILTSVLIVITLANLAMLVLGIISVRKRKNSRNGPPYDTAVCNDIYLRESSDVSISSSAKKDYIKLLKDFSKAAESDVKEDSISPVILDRRIESDREFMKEAEAALLRNISDATYSVDRFCQDMHRERSGVFRHISRITGMTPSRYIEHGRVAMAMKLLREDKSITDETLAEKSGFKSCRAMYNAFLSNLGMSPAEYRNILAQASDNPTLFP